MSIFANLFQLVRRGDDETAPSDRMVSSFAGTATPKDSFFVHDRPYEQYDSVKSEWIAVTALLFLWLLTLLARQIAVMVDVRARMRHEQESGETTERQPLLSSNLKDRAGEWAPKFDRAADALRVTLLMLLAATIFVSIPMPYTCQLENPHNPGNKRCFLALADNDPTDTVHIFLQASQSLPRPIARCALPMAPRSAPPSSAGSLPRCRCCGSLWSWLSSTMFQPPSPGPLSRSQASHSFLRSSVR
ncbi:hypothetical protein BDZ88DRAFT_101732 [Geranomyces variabilis]|nr:hypothetical protein BDZ88DRAFT_101732 [Geranomyces variabilis]